MSSKLLTHIKKLELASKEKSILKELIENCDRTVKELIENPQPNRRFDDYIGDGKNK